MGFKASRRYGRFWDDAVLLDSLIRKQDFYTSGKDERFFESTFASVLQHNKKNFNSEVITQTHKSSIVQSIYCFGKNHRPDMALGDSGIAVEPDFDSFWAHFRP